MKDHLDKLIRKMVEGGIQLDEGVEAFEKGFIDQVLEQLGGNQTSAARRLGIHRNTLSRKIARYKLHANGRRR